MHQLLDSYQCRTEFVLERENTREIIIFYPMWLHAAYTNAHKHKGAHNVVCRRLKMAK